MRKNNKLNNIKWLIIIILAWILFLKFLGLAISIFDFAFEIIMLFFGIVLTVFNKQLYNYMVKLNVWGFGKIGTPEIGFSTKTNAYRKFYRISTFIIGLIALYLGVAGILFKYGINLYFN